MNTWNYKDLRISALAFFRDLAETKDNDKRLEEAMRLAQKLYDRFSEPENDLAKPIEKVEKSKPLIIDGEEVPF